jgi:hypothetical protein
MASQYLNHLHEIINFDRRKEDIPACQLDVPKLGQSCCTEELVGLKMRYTMERFLTLNRRGKR